MSFLSEMSKYGWMFSFTSVVLVFVGWAVTYSNQMKIATRAETKSLVDALAKVINEISDVSINFWLKKTSEFDPLDPALSSKAENAASEHIMIIFSKSNQASRYFTLLEQRGVGIESRVSTLILSSTYECEEAHKLSPSSRSDRTSDIMNECINMMGEVYDHFQIKYPPSSHKKIWERIKEKSEEIDEWHKSLQ